MGGFLTEAFLEAGARVVVPSRSQEKLRALRDWLEVRAGETAPDRLVALEGNIGDERGAEQLKDVGLDIGSL